uniref:DNA-directed DNA polymerase n=1 Tax=Meloidogyne enterolobii TaxID=390850 RepID=A0A6V7W5K8_MELEN|nr:unnamed protein product [Meloidogyne enterolobii]
MSLFFDELPDIGPLFPRDAFHGGRTGPLSLKCHLEDSAENEYEISCYDVVSLYPAVNFYAFYPIGHPELLDLNLDINWTKPEDLRPYRGIFKLFIIPPDDLYLPVIPERIHGKLIFHLCHQCAIEIEPGVAKRKQTSYSYGRKWCQHDDNKRGFVSTTCSVELELALSRGYRATKVYSIYNWEEWSDELLRPYVQDMMRLKIEASGWPSSVLSPDNIEQEERLKNDFIVKNQKEYGITLEPSKIARNEGLRYLAKTCNNSMWGRWALRCNLTQDCITSSPIKLHAILNDPKLEVGAIEMLTPDLFAVPYKNRREFVRPHDKYNIILALITTATARVMLYDFMEKIVNDNECKLLYTDTDSCFFVHKRNKKPPFRVGDMLGMMSREYEEWAIISFYTGGCKQYAMKMKHRETGEIKYIVKCRGLWEQVDTPLDFNQFRKMVEAYGEEQDPVVLQRTHFQPNWRKGQVISRTQIRRYTPIYDKGFVDANFDCYPYGYRGEPINDPTKFVLYNISFINSYFVVSNSFSNMISDINIDNTTCLLERLKIKITANSHPPIEIVGEQQQNIFIFHSQRFGFDNRFRSSFTLLGKTFSSVEQFFIWQKARFFGDLEIAEEVLMLDNPIAIRRIGKRIRGYNQIEWNSVRNKVMYTGLWAKFTQNTQLFNQLRATGDGLIAQASASELYWSNGVCPKSARLKDPSRWDTQHFVS